MKTYLRRLWAALCGRGFQPLNIGSPIAFRGPGGEVVRVEITAVTYEVDFRSQAHLRIDAEPPIYRLEHQR